MNRWRRLPDPSAGLQQRKSELCRAKQELLGLPAVRAYELAELNKGPRQTQLTRFLERHRIEVATIPGIGPTRKARLQAQGIDDATDITSVDAG